jgi:hypothetical protein
LARLVIAVSGTPGTGGTTCTYTLGAASYSASAAASQSTVNVTTQSGCAWTATSNAAWITITAGSSGTGNGTVSYTVAANNTLSTLTGTVGSTGTFTGYFDGGSPSAYTFNYGNGFSNTSPLLMGTGNGGNGAVPGQMLNVGAINTKWGRRLFIGIQSNGQTLKFFGTRKQLAEALTAAGYARMAERIDEGMALNVPCRVTTKPSEDGREGDYGQRIGECERERRQVIAGQPPAGCDAGRFPGNADEYPRAKDDQECASCKPNPKLLVNQERRDVRHSEPSQSSVGGVGRRGPEARYKSGNPAA